MTHVAIARVHLENTPDVIHERRAQHRLRGLGGTRPRSARDQRQEWSAAASTSIGFVIDQPRREPYQMGMHAGCVVLT